MMSKRTIANIAGSFALLLWATSGLLMSCLRALPVFEVLSLAFIISFIQSIVILTAQKAWNTIPNRVGLWLIGILGVCGCDFLFVSAFHYAPAAHVDLINYLWPILILIMGASFGDKIHWPHGLATLLGFYGVYYLLTNGQGINGFNTDYGSGYALAFCGALCWCAYSLSLRYCPRIHESSVGLYCGIGAVIMLVCHLQFETTVVPSGTQFFGIIYMGIMTQGVAFLCWAYGIRHGNYSLLCVLSYIAPLISVMLLVAFGVTKPHVELWTSCGFITLALLFAGIEPHRLSQLSKRLSRLNPLREVHESKRHVAASK